MLMRKVAALLLIAAAFTAYADNGNLAGSYRGPSEGYGLVIEMAPDGKLRGNYVELGHVAVLNAIEVQGQRFTANASYDDGSTRRITGSFSRRGIRVDGVPIEDVGAVETFFERL
jgi:hypothetical protein